jgi:hypothetical protein
MSEHPTITEHPITYAEAVSLAWMLDLVAARSREMGCPDAAGGFEACATTFRQSVEYSLDSIVEMTESTIRNLAATVTTVGDRLADEDDQQAGRSSAWALIADELFYRDEHGARLSAFFAECPTPELLPRFVQATVAGFRSRLEGEIEGLFG